MPSLTELGGYLAPRLEKTFFSMALNVLAESKYRNHNFKVSIEYVSN